MVSSLRLRMTPRHSGCFAQGLNQTGAFISGHRPCRLRSHRRYASGQQQRWTHPLQWRLVDAAIEAIRRL